MNVLDLFRINGKVALITGGNSGIGFAIAKALGEAGASVAITGRDPKKLNTAVGRLSADGLDTTGIVGDVTIHDEAKATVEKTIQAFGQIDILVNNVGRGSNTPTENMPFSDWNDLIEKNLTSVFRMCQFVAPAMLERRSGNIINLGSISGFVVNRPQHHSPYEAAKAGVHHLTRSLAAEWADRGIRVNAIAPGFVMEDGLPPSDPTFRKYWADEVPMARVARPNEIAPAALYLASEASSFTTGTILLVDGGYTIW